jgi:hypothetical protein
MTRIDLSSAELFICRTLGVMRRSSAMNKVVDQQMGKQDVWAIDMDGVIGEVCVAKALNVCPDLTIGIRSGGADLISRDKKTIDIKTTRVKNGRLLSTISKQKNPCDIYVLAVVDDYGCNVVGWASKEELFLEENKIDLGHGVGFALEQDRLHKEIYDSYQ